MQEYTLVVFASGWLSTKENPEIICADLDDLIFCLLNTLNFITDLELV